MWDRLAISCPSFPCCYWDKFVKKKVLEKYGGQFERESVSELLGVDTSQNMNISPKQRQEQEAQDSENRGTFASITEHDWRYAAWKAGVVMTDRIGLKMFFFLKF
jgi:hypothetical protein